MKGLRISQLLVVGTLILGLCISWSVAGPQEMSAKQLNSYYGAGTCGEKCDVGTCDPACTSSTKGECKDGATEDCCSFETGGEGDGCVGGTSGKSCPKSKCSDC